jgi:hypothetical protein
LICLRFVNGHEGEQECSHGLLYISEAGKDITVPVLHIFELDHDLATLKENSTLTGFAGKPNQALGSTETGRYLTSTYWGNKTNGYKDGVVNFVDTGVSKESHGDHFHIDQVAPTIVNTKLECGPVWHSWSHSGRVTLFCDGNRTENITSTFFLIDESLLGNSTNAIVYNKSLEGSHHGMAVPMDTSHVLHSLYDADHEWGSDLLVVADLQGNVIHRLDNMDDPKSHCTDYHGGGAIDNTVVMCCADKALGVDYNPNSNAVNTRVLTFPDTYGAKHRCGEIHPSKMNKYAIGDFSDWDAEPYQAHLMAFPIDATVITDKDVIIVEGGICKFDLEKSAEKHVVAMAKNGTVFVFEYGRPNGWIKVASVEGAKFGLTDCDNANFTVGYTQFFVSEWSSKKLFMVDMSKVNSGSLDIKSMQLLYTPGEMIVGGVPTGAGCNMIVGTQPATKSASAMFNNNGRNHLLSAVIGTIATIYWFM